MFKVPRGKEKPAFSASSVIAIRRVHEKIVLIPSPFRCYRLQ